MPLSVALMAVSLFAVDRGYLDDVELEKVGDFEIALHSYMQSEKAELLDRINETGDFDDEIEAELKAAVDEFKANHAW